MSTCKLLEYFAGSEHFPQKGCSGKTANCCKNAVHVQSAHLRDSDPYKAVNDLFSITASLLISVLQVLQFISCRGLLAEYTDRDYK